MRFPWQPKTENYESAGYTDALVTALIRQASGNAGSPITYIATAALESVAGVVGRAFAAADVSGDPMYTSALTPACMMMLGRDLIRSGDRAYYLDTSNGLTIIPSQTHSIGGGPMPSSWRYELTLPGPSTTRGINVGANDVLHLRYAVDPERPWRGMGPLGVAADAGRLSAEVLAALADEASGPRGSFLPGSTADDTTTASMKADVKSSRGTMLVVESLAVNTTPVPTNEWTQQRFGANPPAGLVSLLQQARMEVWSACGVSGALFEAESSGALREAWRVALFGLIAPLGKLLQSELQRAVDPSIVIDWTELRASDLSGRARAFQSMVGGGMAVADAVAISGLMVPPDTN